MKKIYEFISRKAHLLISTAELRSFLERAEADTKPAVHDNEAEENQIINIDDIPVLPDSSGGERRTRIKTYLTDRLQTMVKTSVDICLKAIEAGKIDEVMAIILKNADLVEDTLRDLEEFRRTQLINEIAEDNNQIVENSNARQSAPDDDIEDQNTIIVVNTPRKPKVEPEEKYIQIKNPPKLKARKKEHIEIKDDTSEDGKLKDDASEHGENRRRQRNRG